MDTMVSISSLQAKCTDMINILDNMGSRGNSAIYNVCSTTQFNKVPYNSILYLGHFT